jgi:signal transduction histidine kinase
MVRRSTRPAHRSEGGCQHHGRGGVSYLVPCGARCHDAGHEGIAAVMHRVAEPAVRHDRRWSRLAWGLCVASLGIGAVGTSLGAIYGTSIGPGVVFVPMILVFGTVGAFIASRRPENAIGWLFIAVASTWSVSVVAYGWAARAADIGDTTSGVAIFADWLQTWLYIVGLTLAILPLFVMFPTGHPISRRWAPLLWLAYFAVGAISMAAAFAPGTYDPRSGDTAFITDNPYALSRASMAALGLTGGIAAVAAAAGGIASLIVRLRRAHGDERAQIRWLVYAALMVVVIGLGTQVVLKLLLGGDPWTVPGPWVLILLVAIFGSVAFVPIGAAIGILKYHLYGIDVVIRKTVVITVVTVVLVSLYLAVVALTTVGPAPRLLVAALLFLVTFRLVRNAARSFADRVVYGKRATSYEVLSEFSERMADTYATDDVLPRMAHVLLGAVGAEGAAVWLRVGDTLRAVASAGESPSTTFLEFRGDELPASLGSFAAEVRHQGALLGALSVTMPVNDELDGGRERLIRDLAGQAGLVLRNARLIEELKASRQRLVAAQDEERRKLERNIHDGAQQQLVALGVKQRLVAAMIGKDDDRARAILEELQGEMTTALEDLRDLARGIYPPLLADKGLGTALEAQARKAAVSTTVEADGVGRYPPEVEATVYFCALEALNNVAKYAHATHASVRLEKAESQLRFEVADDGEGFDQSRTGYGTGLQGMADRLAALGGRLDVTSSPGAGTTVMGSLPVGSIPDR